MIKITSGLSKMGLLDLICDIKALDRGLKSFVYRHNNINTSWHGL